MRDWSKLRNAMSAAVAALTELRDVAEAERSAGLFAAAQIATADLVDAADFDGLEPGA